MFGSKCSLFCALVSRPLKWSHVSLTLFIELLGKTDAYHGEAQGVVSGLNIQRQSVGWHLNITHFHIPFLERPGVSWYQVHDGSGVQMLAILSTLLWATSLLATSMWV